MKKSNDSLKYVGPLEDLLFNAEKASSDFWIVTLNDIPYKLNDVVFHKTQKKAEMHLSIISVLTSFKDIIGTKIKKIPSPLKKVCYVIMVTLKRIEKNS